MNEKGRKRRLAEIEASLRATEQLLGVRFTIIDNNGALHDDQGPLLGSMRQSHQANRVCHVGFEQACVEHCRYEVAEQVGDTQGPDIHHCWKGLEEIVVPLVWRGRFIGLLYAGIWPGQHPPQRELSVEFYHERDKLPVPNRKRLKTLKESLPLIAEGLVKQLDEVLTGRRSNDRKNQIRLFIHRNYPSEITLADLAKELGLSPSRARHLVKELCGTSFQTLRQRYRLNAAKNLLTTTTLQSQEIATRVGIKDPYQFNRLFKARFGTSPIKYRKSQVAKFST